MFTQNRAAEAGWKVESTIEVSSYVACKKVINLLQDKGSKNRMTADSNNYPLVAMTLARSSALHGSTAITFGG